MEFKGIMGIGIRNKEDKTYIVLGAPQSATSFIAKILDDNGVDMGLQKGTGYYFEDKDFRKLNEKILEDAGGAMHNPPEEKEILKTDHEDGIKSLVESKKKKFWGWKDPRTSLTLKKYLPFLEDDVYLICCFRRPDRTAESLDGKHRFRGNVREKIDHYNRAIISAVKEFCEL